MMQDFFIFIVKTDKCVHSSHMHVGAVDFFDYHNNIIIRVGLFHFFTTSAQSSMSRPNEASDFRSLKVVQICESTELEIIFSFNKSCILSRF